MKKNKRLLIRAYTLLNKITSLCQELPDEPDLKFAAASIQRLVSKLESDLRWG